MVHAGGCSCRRHAAVPCSPPLPRHLDATSPSVLAAQPSYRKPRSGSSPAFSAQQSLVSAAHVQIKPKPLIFLFGARFATSFPPAAR